MKFNPNFTYMLGSATAKDNVYHKNPNYIHEEKQSNLQNACYHPIPNLLFSCLLSKNKD
jgi:hypothetical protein